MSQRGLVKDVVSGTTEQVLFWECAKGGVFGFCFLGRIFHSHSWFLEYRRAGPISLPWLTVCSLIWLPW